MKVTVTNAEPQANFSYINVDGVGMYYLAPTFCCAVTMVKNLVNHTPLSHIKEITKLIEKQARESSGATNILVFTKPHETDLSANLLAAGFTKLSDKVSRRFQYERVPLTMFIYTI